MNTILTHNISEPLTAGGLVFSCATLVATQAEIELLGPDHHDEVSSEGRVYSPNWQAVKDIEAVGGFRLYVARDIKTNDLAGYVGYFISMSLHYHECKQALAHALYLRKEHRRGTNAANLIRYSEHDLSNLGVKFVHQAVTSRHDYSALVKRMGYTESETIYCKRIGG